MYLNPIDMLMHLIDQWMDYLADIALKMYYWPFWIAGNFDNLQDISMCRFR